MRLSSELAATKQVSLTLLATGVKLVAYAPGRMKAAASERARHLQITEPVFRLFGVPKSRVGDLELLIED